MGVCACVCVCLSVCYHSSGGITRFYAKKKVRIAVIGFSRFLISGFQKKQTIQELWHEKANMLMTTVTNFSRFAHQRYQQLIERLKVNEALLQMLATMHLAIIIIIIIIALKRD